MTKDTNLRCETKAPNKKQETESILISNDKISTGAIKTDEKRVSTGAICVDFN